MAQHLLVTLQPHARPEGLVEAISGLEGVASVRIVAGVEEHPGFTPLDLWSRRFRSELATLELPPRLFRAFIAATTVQRFREGRPSQPYLVHDHVFRDESGRLLEFREWMERLVSTPEAQLARYAMSRIGTRSIAILVEAYRKKRLKQP